MKPPAFDPVYLHARREALVILAMFAACLVWTISAAYIWGYGEAPASGSIETVLGMPAWVFWAIFVPWIAVGGATILFSLFVLADDDLSDPHQPNASPEEKAAEPRPRERDDA